MLFLLLSGAMKDLFRRYLHNKYFYTGMFFLIWMLFFDQENLIVQYELSATLHQLEDQKIFYLEETAVNRETIQLLETDSAKLETLAREKYYMKRENEDIFVIIREEDR